MFETILPYSTKSAQSPVNSREKEIMRRSSINPFASGNTSQLHDIEEEKESANPFQMKRVGLKNKLSVSSRDSDGISNPFTRPQKKVANPFQAQSNPFQTQSNPFQSQSNPFQQNQNPFQNDQSEEKPEQPANDEMVNKLVDKLSLKIEVKDKDGTNTQNMVFLEENQKRQILLILKPFLTSNLNGPDAEMVMKIKSRKNSIDKPIETIKTKVPQILEESEPSEKESRKELERISETIPDQPIPQETTEPVISEVKNEPRNGEWVQIQQIEPSPDLVENPVNQRIQETEPILKAPVHSENYTMGTFNQPSNPIPRTYEQPMNANPVTYTQPAHFHQNNFMEPTRHIKPVPVNQVDPVRNSYSNDIFEQTNYQYVSVNKPEINYEISPNYQAINVKPNLNKTKNFKLKSVIRSITTTKRPSQMRPHVERKIDEDEFQMNVNKTQFPMVNLDHSALRDSTVNLQSNQSQYFLDGNNSYIRLQSNKFQESQLMNQTGYLESNYTSAPNRNFYSNFVSTERYGVSPEMGEQARNVANPDTIDYTENNFKQAYENQNVVPEVSEQEPKIELYKLIQNNQLISVNNDPEQYSDRVITKKYQTNDYFRQPRQQTHTISRTPIESSFVERFTHDPSSVPVNRQQVLEPRQSKPTKRSFTKGLRIFRKVKDSQGNIVKENLEQSINIYSTKILTELKQKKMDTQDLMSPNAANKEQEEDSHIRNYKTHLYSTSTVNTPIARRGLTSDRVISSLNEKKTQPNLIYSSSRNIQDSQRLFTYPSKSKEQPLTTSLFYSGTKTENNSGRSSNIKNHYVRSTRVSPAITLGTRSHGIQCRRFV